MLAKKLLAGTVSPITLEYVGYNSSLNSSSVALSSALFNVGDLVFFFDNAGAAFSVSESIPSGWTKLLGCSAYAFFAGHRHSVSYKIITSGDLDTYIYGMSNVTFNQKVLFGFRANKSMSGLTSDYVDCYNGQSNPAGNSIPAFTTYPYVVIGGFHTPTTSSGQFDTAWYDSIYYPTCESGETTGFAFNIFNSGGESCWVDIDYTASGTENNELFSAAIFPTFS